MLKIFSHWRNWIELQEFLLNILSYFGGLDLSGVIIDSCATNTVTAYFKRFTVHTNILSAASLENFTF